jgi:hypothetical protein
MIYFFAFERASIIPTKIIIIMRIFFRFCNSSDNQQSPEQAFNMLNYSCTLQEKERKLNEMIQQLQMVREQLLSQTEKVSAFKTKPTLYQKNAENPYR